MLERKWLAVQATPFTANGTATGIVTIADTAGFRTKQSVFVTTSSLPPAQFQVQEVLSETQLVLGPVNTAKVGRQHFSDLTPYTLALGAAIAAPEQDRLANPPDKDHYAAVYESDPVVADRVILVDQYGKLFGDGNPLPIAFDGTIAVGNVTLQDDDGDELEINPDGSINVNIVTAQTNNKVKNQYGQASAVPSGVETTVVQYVVPLVLTSAILQRISVSGENVARFQVFVNGVLIDTRRTYYGTNLNEYFEYAVNTTDGVTLAPGDIVAVKVLHSRAYVGDFEGRIQAFEIA